MLNADSSQGCRHVAGCRPGEIGAHCPGLQALRSTQAAGRPPLVARSIGQFAPSVARDDDEPHFLPSCLLAFRNHLLLTCQTGPIGRHLATQRAAGDVAARLRAGRAGPGMPSRVWRATPPVFAEHTKSTGHGRSHRQAAGQTSRAIKEPGLPRVRSGSRRPTPQPTDTEIHRR